MAISKCAFPGCGVTGETPSATRLYACEKHTKWLVTGYRATIAAGSAVLAAASERYVTKRSPWWAKAAIEGLKRGS